MSFICRPADLPSPRPSETGAGRAMANASFVAGVFPAPSARSLPAAEPSLPSPSLASPGLLGRFVPGHAPFRWDASGFRLPSVPFHGGAFGIEAGWDPRGASARFGTALDWASPFRGSGWFAPVTAFAPDCFQPSFGGGPRVGFCGASSPGWTVAEPWSWSAGWIAAPARTAPPIWADPAPRVFPRPAPAPTPHPRPGPIASPSPSPPAWPPTSPAPPAAPPLPTPPAAPPAVPPVAPPPSPPVSPPASPPVSPPVSPPPPAGAPGLSAQQAADVATIAGLAQSGGRITAADQRRVAEIYARARPSPVDLQNLKEMALDAAGGLLASPNALAHARDWGSYSEAQRRGAVSEFVGLLNDQLGLSVGVRYFSQAPVNGLLTKGYYDPNTDEFHLNTHPSAHATYGEMLSTAFHEMVHAKYFDKTFAIPMDEVLERAEAGEITYIEALARFNMYEGLYLEANVMGVEAYQTNPHEQLAFSGQYFFERAVEEGGIPSPTALLAGNPLFDNLRRHDFALVQTA